MTITTPPLTGIHHVTAITADARRNVGFYCGVLGLRLVKRTVNYDDPGSYHLYYGDELGRPGTVMTFFAWPGAARGRTGPPQVTVTAFAVPSGSLGYWRERLAHHAVEAQPVQTRFGEQVLFFSDPDGMRLELVASSDIQGHPWSLASVPREHGIRGLHSVTMAQEGYEKTARLLTEVMGFRLGQSEGNRFRYRAGAGSGFAATVDLLCVPDQPGGTLGAGIVHHVAFRTPDDPQQAAWRTEIAGLGFNISPVMDRNYFHSIYFREPGGILFEIATDQPGFTVDETPEELGNRLMLPPQYEGMRSRIERHLPPLSATAHEQAL